MQDPMLYRNLIARAIILLSTAGMGMAPIWSCAALQSATSLPVSKGPYLQVPGATTMTVMWESLTNHPGTVYFGRNGGLGQRLGPITPRRLEGLTPFRRTNYVTSATNGVTMTKTNVISDSATNSYYVYQAALTNLKPGAIHTYAIDVAGKWTAPRAFKTFSAARDFVRFAAYGDSRSNPKVHRALAQRMIEHQPEFVLHTGDLVLAGKDYGSWSKEFFEPVAGMADRVPILSVAGNHEEDLKNYLAYFPMSGTNRWYSFDAGPVHVLALDYHFEKDTSDQFKFAQRDLLGSKAPWKVVFVHNPIFNYGHHNSGWGHQSYLPLFQEAKVDLVLSGHSHMYERFRPVAPTTQPGAWAVTCITTAGGGAELHEPHPHPAQAVAISTNHFVLFDVTRDMLRAHALRADGVEIDAFEIRKPGGRQAAEYLAQVYPEELVRISYEVGSALLGKLATLPTNQQPAKAMLTLPPLKQPLELEISLAPESARYYSVKELPLRVATPSPGGTNRIVWVTVHAIAGNKIKGPELDPPLVFKARVAAAQGETIAYGPLSRTSQSAAGLAKTLAGAGAPSTVTGESAAPPRIRNGTARMGNSAAH
jgi:predicted phosphodiesterase